MQIDLIKNFVETDEGRRWHNASAETWFQEGVKVAQMTIAFQSTNDPILAAANWHRMEGARLMAAHMLSLTERPEKRQVDPKANLIHKT